MPPLMGGLAPGTGMDATAQGGGTGDSGSAPDMNQMVGQVREAVAPFEKLLASMPALAPQQTKLKQLIKETLVAMSSAAKQSTPSGQQLPG